MGQELLKVFAAHECVYAADVDGVRETGAPQIVLDFSSPKALPVTIGACERFRAACVVGTTALGEGDLAALRDLATRVPVVQSFNFSQGVTILKMMLRSFAPLLAVWDVEITETHHNKKKDAPSGTAKTILEILDQELGTREKVYGRVGETERKNEIGVHVIRGGDIVGDHSVLFAGNFECIEISHRAYDRAVFARGAVRAARWVPGREPRIYSMQEVLGL
jgi:4-hydroxy-tetrahydrodipicolinate reductase